MLAGGCVELASCGLRGQVGVRMQGKLSPGVMRGRCTRRGGLCPRASMEGGCEAGRRRAVG